MIPAVFLHSIELHLFICLNEWNIGEKSFRFTAAIVEAKSVTDAM